LFKKYFAWPGGFWARLKRRICCGQDGRGNFAIMDKMEEETMKYEQH
jgi:hypothetical protein